LHRIHRSVDRPATQDFLPEGKKGGGRLFELLFSLSLFLAVFVIRLLPVQAQVAGQNSGSSTNAATATVVRAAMKNVDFHLTDRIVVHIATLDGSLTPNHGGVPVFDDKESFHLDVDSATILVSTTALSNDLNDYVFAKPDAPLKKLTVTTQGNELVLKGVLASKGGIPFETDGTVAATPDGQIRVHTLKVKALHLPVKGLMDLLGLDTAKMIDTKKINGVTADKDDLILDPQQLLPPPQMRGHLSSIQIENGAISLIFGTEGQKGKHEAISSRCGGRNFQAFRGGAVRFGKLTMSDTDLELIDSDPSDPFDFSIDHYQDQLIAGYSKMTKQGGLCVHMPDFKKLKQNSQH
jgi:hypothetical protein